METFLKGLVLGFGIAAPVGPIGLLCIRRSMSDGRLVGFVSGLGAASADAIYGLIAAVGLTALTRFLLDYRGLLQLLGSVFLIFFGLSILRSRPPAAAPGRVHARTLATAYTTTLGLTLANPATILAFVAIFAGLGIAAGAGGIVPAAELVGGVFLGSAAWWLLLSSLAGYLGGKMGTKRLPLLNRVSGALIVAFGIAGLVSLSR